MVQTGSSVVSRWISVRLDLLVEKSELFALQQNYSVKTAEIVRTMGLPTKTPLLDSVSEPHQLRALDKRSLRQFADELRKETIDVVSVTGGHLGAGLGVVELTVALHYVFDTPTDKLVWDVGHQAYPHKILTGRRERMRTLRQGGGLSGFTKRSESVYDAFGAAHSSTSISASLGFAVARDLKGENNNVIAVIGDGAMSAYLARLVSSHTYRGLRNIGKRIARHLPRSMKIGAQRAEEFARGMVTGGTLFEELGFYYVGPIDGHNLDHLIPVLENVRDMQSGPVLVHVVTKKGKGYAPAEASADKYHGVTKFNVLTGEQKKSNAKAPAYQKVFGESLIAEGKKDDRIVAITAAMPSGTGVDLFQKVFPSRTFDVGIAEQHAVTFAAGLAADGMKPYCAIYSTFLQRAYDQVVHDVAIQSLPVRFAMDRAGLVGADGPTHAGSFDIAYLGALPNFVLMAAADEVELMHMVATTVGINDRPSALRYPRGEGWGLQRPPEGTPLAIGKGRVLREGTSIAILSYGTRLFDAMLAAEKLSGYGLSATVADARFCKPLDQDLVRRLAREHEVLITVEEGSVGGFGAHVMQFLAYEGLLDRGLKIRPMTLPDRFIDQDAPDKMYEAAGLDAKAIVQTALNALGRESEASAPAHIA